MVKSNWMRDSNTASGLIVMCSRAQHDRVWSGTSRTSCPPFRDFVGGDPGCVRAEPASDIVQHGGDLRVGIGGVERRHKHFAVRRPEASALQDRLCRVDRGGVIHGSIADERGIGRHDTAAVEAMATRTGALEDAQAEALIAAGGIGRLRGRDLRGGRWLRGKLAPARMGGTLFK